MNRLIPEEDIKEKQKKKEKVKNNFQFKFLNALVNGDLFTRDKLVGNIPFFVFLTFIIILYIGYGYYIDKTSRSIAELEEQSRDLKAELNNENAYYNQMSMYSHLADSIEAEGLKPSVDPPEKIKVNIFEFDARK